MCGSIKLEGAKSFTLIRSFIQSTFLTANHHGCERYLWNGFARADGSADGIKKMSEQWDPDIWIPEIIRVEGFTERDRTLESRLIREAKKEMKKKQEESKTKIDTTIDMREIRKKTIIPMPAKRIAVITSADGILKIITRPARTQYEMDIHHRMPLRIPAIMTRAQFINDFNKLARANYH